MKYNDRYTKKATEKHLAKIDNPESDRERRRRRERVLKKFEIKICSVVDRIWWKSLTLDMKESAYINYINESQRKMIMGVNFDFKKWTQNYQKNNKPDTVLYRENRIEDLLT